MPLISLFDTTILETENKQVYFWKGWKKVINTTSKWYNKWDWPDLVWWEPGSMAWGPCPWHTAVAAWRSPTGVRGAWCGKGQRRGRHTSSRWTSCQSCITLHRWPHLLERRNAHEVLKNITMDINMELKKFVWSFHDSCINLRCAIFKTHKRNTTTGMTIILQYYTLTILKASFSGY